MDRVVIDTNVFVSALFKAESAPRGVLTLCLSRQITPIMGSALFWEYREVMGRDSIQNRFILSPAERNELLKDYLNLCDWPSINYRWRPNLRDEADNHLIDLAIAGGADWIITGNKRDFLGGEMMTPQFKVASPGEFLTERKAS